MSPELTKEKLQKYHRQPKTEFTVYLPNICSSLFLWFCLEKQPANLKTTEFLTSFVVRSGHFWSMKQEVKIGLTFLRKFIFLFPLPVWNADKAEWPPARKSRTKMETKDGKAERELRPGTLVTGERGVSFWACGNQRRHLWGLGNWGPNWWQRGNPTNMWYWWSVWLQRRRRGRRGRQVSVLRFLGFVL